MDVLSETMKVAGLDKQLDDIEEAVSDVISKEVVDELDRIEQDGTAKSSLQQAQRHASKFKEFLTLKKLPEAVETCSETTLNTYLRYYYSTLRKTDGSYLAPMSLGCLMAGIQRYLASAPVNRVINIINGENFSSANRMLRSIGTQFLKFGGRTTRFLSI